ncbi:glutathione S-transferase family protein [Paraglaciecola chathamensis]|uniref:glutathione S-transferase family protein n=1 Tax=Paraglaciecola chathamensis TaxID=368405 RepID=UPI0026FAF6A8|nr:glutathione S-transferase family protein [Paraglaciecola chathamensis]MDO6841573.1 glutathione S-transferase family protein [Paraglaciecola chathamensis]
MQLINLDHSPYATRVRILIRKKQLDIAIVAPTFALKTPEFLAAYPLGKIPLLGLDNGQYLPESIAIMEYLEDAYPTRTLRPTDPLAAAQSRVLASFTDTHLAPALLPYFKAMMLPEFTFDENAQYDVVRATLEKLDQWLATNADMGSQALTLGDIVLAPTFWWVDVTVGAKAKSEITNGLNSLNQWWDWVRSDADVQNGLSEMASAFAAFQRQQA